MKLTKTADFAIRLLIHLSKNPTQVHHMAVMSKQLMIPYHNLTKLIQTLSKAQFIITKKGKGGGVRLALPADQLDLKMIIDLIDGPTVLSECQQDTSLCALSNNCKLKSKFTEIQNKINTIMSDVKLTELV